MVSVCKCRAVSPDVRGLFQFYKSLAARFALGFAAGRTARRQVQEQQRTFRQQRLAAGCAQIVQHWQQYQRNIAATAEQAFDIDR